MKTDRREFLKMMGLGGLAALTQVDQVQAMEESELPNPKKGKGDYWWGMVIDLDACIGCEACIVACRAENNVPTAGPEETANGRAIYWMDRLHFTDGEFPQVTSKFIPTPCNHCEEAPCIKVCPVGATYRSEDGIIGQIFARCIGCRYCTTACPYTRRYFNWYEPKWGDDEIQQLNPEVSVRPKGVVEKCTFCVHRIQKAKEVARLENRKVKDGDVQTACQEGCPVGAIHFGNYKDPESEVSKLCKSSRAFRLQEDLGTSPKVVYLQERNKE